MSRSLPFMVAILATSTLAHAQSDRELATRQELLAQSEALAEKGMHAEAVTVAKRAAAIRMTPSVRQFLAKEQRAAGLLAEAYGNGRQCLVEAQVDAQLKNRALILAACTDVVESLAGRVARVTVKLPAPVPPGLRVSIAGEEVSDALVGEPYVVSPGKLAVTATALGYLPFTTDLDVPEGGAVEVNVHLSLEPSVQPCPAGEERVTGVCVPVVAAAAQASGRSPGRVAWAIGVGAAGVAGVGVGTVFGLMASSKLSTAEGECPSHTSCPTQAVHDRSTTLTYAAVSTTGFIAGGALLAGGVTLYFTAPRTEAPRVGLSLAPGELRLAGRF
jgi:hypothetical protein